MIANQVNKISDSVLFLAGDGNYTHIHFLVKPAALYATTLSAFEKEMPSFVRIHKSYLINPAYITDCRSNGIKSIEVLIGRRWLPVSRRRTDAVESVLKQIEEIT